MRRAAIYARYSSDRQRATSIDHQLRLCRDAASKLDCLVIDAHVYTDEEMSGAVEQRPGYLRLLEAAKSRQVEVILVESQDRLWRDQGEMHNALKRLRFWSIRVIAVTSGTDLTDRTGRLVASVMGWKDEAFLEDLRDKTRRGMIGQVSRGLSAGGRAYGYRSEPVHDELGQIIGVRRVIDPDEATIVRRIYASYRDGQSPKTIAHRMNAEGIAPPRPVRGRRVKGWTWSTISGSPKKASGILNNPLYVGRIAWNRSQKVRDPDTGKRLMRMRPPEEWVWSDVPDLRIISQDLWEAVQDRRRGRHCVARGNMRGRRATALLSGILVCAPCGSHYVLNKPRYYGCTAHRDRGRSICANGRLVRRDYVEDLVLDLVFSKVFSADRVQYVLRQVNHTLASMTATEHQERARWQRERERAQEELEHVAAAIRSGILTPTTRSLLEECERRVDESEAMLRGLDVAPQHLVALPGLITEHLGELRDVLHEDTDRARTVLERLVGTIPLRPVGTQLVGTIRGNLVGLLNLEVLVAKSGAGRGIQYVLAANAEHLPCWTEVPVR